MDFCAYISTALVEKERGKKESSTRYFTGASWRQGRMTDIRVLEEEQLCIACQATIWISNI